MPQWFAFGVLCDTIAQEGRDWWTAPGFPYSFHAPLKERQLEPDPDQAKWRQLVPGHLEALLAWAKGMWVEPGCCRSHFAQVKG